MMIFTFLYGFIIIGGGSFSKMSYPPIAIVDVALIFLFLLYVCAGLCTMFWRFPHTAAYYFFFFQFFTLFLPNKLLSTTTFIPQRYPNPYISAKILVTSLNSSTTSLASLSGKYYNYDNLLPRLQEDLPGELHLTPLPYEIIVSILYHVLRDSDDGDSFSSTISMFARSILPTSRLFHELGLPLLYKHASFTHPHRFDRFLRTIEENPELGLLVKCFDFSDFTSVGLGRTARMNQEIQMVTATTINRALQLCPNLVEFLASENIEGDIDANVISTLFTLPHLQSIDFCGATGNSLTQAFMNASIPEKASNISRLSFHDCTSIPAVVFENLLPRLPNLSRLDLTHTLISSKALFDIPSSCDLTHLSLAKCPNLSGADIIKFLMGHPATQYSLVWLSLLSDARSSCPFSESQVKKILKFIHPNLRYLNISGLPIHSSHLDIIKTRFSNLQSLSIAQATIEIKDLINFLNSSYDEKTKCKIEVPLRFLNVRGNHLINSWSIQDMQFLSSGKYLEAVELDQEVISYITQHLGKLPTIGKTPDNSYWLTRTGQGSRAWLFKISSDSIYVKEAEKLNRSSLSTAVATASNFTNWDPEQMKMVKGKTFVPTFLKYASCKVSTCVGLQSPSYSPEEIEIYKRNSGGDWIYPGPFPFAERGIYKYYSLRRI